MIKVRSRYHKTAFKKLAQAACEVLGVVGDAVVEFAHGVVPVVNIVEPLAVAHASSWKTDKLRLQVGNGLRHIGPQSVFAMHESVFGKEAHHIDGKSALFRGCDAQLRVCGATTGFHRCFQLFPAILFVEF